MRGRDVPAEEDPATRDGSIGMLAGSINPRGGRRVPCNRMTEFTVEWNRLVISTF